MRALLSAAASACFSLASNAVGNVRKTPIFLWAYLAVLIVVAHKTARILGYTLARKRIIGRVTLKLTLEEEAIAASVVDPRAISETFADVGGLEAVKQTLVEHVVWPLKFPHMFPEKNASDVIPLGVLLYGPPGTGKTMLARALAKELDSFFLDISIDSLFSKYVGESEKLAAAVFSLAHKLRSCVVFVDEIDALLSTRGQDDHAVYTHAKTIFLSKWDGLMTRVPGDSVLIVGATNRAGTLDAAALRRLPIQLKVQYPTPEARMFIIKCNMKDKNVSPTFDWDLAVKRTDKYSGSDLREVCKAASLVAMRSVLGDSSTGVIPTSHLVNGGNDATAGRIDTKHFVEALTRVQHSADPPISSLLAFSQ